MPEYVSRCMQICILCMANIPERPVLLSRNDGSSNIELLVANGGHFENLLWIFSFHSTWKRCKHSGHFSRFRNIIGNFCIIKQKCLCNYVILNISSVTSEINKVTQKLTNLISWWSVAIRQEGTYLKVVVNVDKYFEWIIDFGNKKMQSW
jgi:hypothetical protein